MEDPISRLMKEFRSLLDETVIVSISSDYNLQDTQDFAAVREVLLTLSKDVEAEEATGFNPSGFGGNDNVDLGALNLDDDVEGTGATSSEVRSADSVTTTTESSIPPSHSTSGSSRTEHADTPTPGLIHVGIFDNLSDDEKEQNLSQMFVQLKLIDIKRALEKSKGDASLAMDELLNLQLLEHEGQRPKGIDGFFVDDDYVPNRKKKGKKKKKKQLAKLSTVQSPSIETPTEGASQSPVDQSEKIALISNGLNLRLEEVTSIYDRRNASLGATAVEILDNYISIGMSQPIPRLLPDIQQATTEFSWVPRQYIQAIFEMSGSQDEALGVIQILADYYQKPAYLKYDVSYSVVASGPELATLDTAAASNSKQATRPPSSLRSPASPISASSSSRGQLATNLFTTPATTANTFTNSRNHSSASAAAAFRKGRGNPLFRQAGSFYAARAREDAANYRQASSAEANRLVDQQSTADKIDLHGVSVLDGVDIALDRTWRWWDGLAGEDRARRARDQGFIIVTGIGRHSVDGRSPLRINVCKALVEDGWKMEVLTGSCRVTGRR